jgi:hypothetical protein
VFDEHEFFIDVVQLHEFLIEVKGELPHFFVDLLNFKLYFEFLPEELTLLLPP